MLESERRAEIMWQGVGTAPAHHTARLARLVLLTSDSTIEQARAHAALGLLMQRAGRHAEASAQLAQAIEHSPADLPDLLRFRAWAARSHALAGGLARAMATAREVVALAQARADPLAVCEGLNVQSLVELCEGRTGAAVHLAREAVALGQEHEDTVPADQLLTHLHLGLALLESDRLDEAHAALTSGYDRKESGGPVGLRDFHLALRSVVNFLIGRWDEAVEDAEQSVRSEGDYLAPGFPMAVCTMIEASRSHDVAARTFLDRAGAEPLGATGRFGDAWLALAASGMTHDTAVAYEALLDGWLQSRPTPYLLTWRLLDPLLIRCALEVGDGELIDSLLEECREGAMRAPEVPSARGAWLRAQALVEGSAEAARAAVESYRSSGRLMAHAQTMLESARILQRHDHRNEAVELAGEAMRVFHRLGARRWTERAGRLHLELLDSEDPGPGERRPAGWDLLTPAQTRVAEMAADGLTTAQIAERLCITQNTVNSHLKHIYGKLHVSSRAQLAARFARRGGRRRSPTSAP